MNERDPRFPDGVGVITDDGVRGRIVSYHNEDNDYAVLVKTNGVPEIEWVEAEDLTVDPEPIPWPGEGDLPVGVFCFSLTGRPGDLEVFGSIDKLIEGRPEGDANAIRNMALQGVADPGEWIRDGSDDTVLLSFQLLDQEVKT